MLHPYATDSERSRIVIVLITLLAILSAWLLGKGLDYFDLDIPWWLDAPSVLGFFGIYWKVFDSLAWSWSLRGFRIFDIPNLSGEWTGKLSSSHDNMQETAITIHIHQSSSKILIQQETETSVSTSVMAVLNCRPGVYNGLTYLYENWPKSKASAQLIPHKGKAHLRLEGSNRLLGEYMTDHSRGNSGTIELTRTRK